MSSNFWFYYTFGFVYLFPLVFSYIRGVHNNPWIATFALVVGVILWVIFSRRIYRQYYGDVNKLVSEAIWLQRNGKRVEAKIAEVISKKQLKDKTNALEIVAEFPNLAGTTIRAEMDMVDTKPTLNRFRKGNSIAMRLNTKKSPLIPWITELGRIESNTASRKWLFPFTILYAIVTFIIHYSVSSDGDGWRWMSLLHPWVWTPAFGLFSIGVFSKVRGKLTSHQESEAYEVMLYGVESTGMITKAEQTGLFVNEQPEMRLVIQYNDSLGREHQVELKQIVLLTELHNYQEGEKRLLYLPDQPNNILLLD